MAKLVLVLVVLIMSVGMASAICDFESAKFHGSCPYDGNIRVFDEQNNLIVEQFYSLNQGCYHGMYVIQVHGGVDQECVLNPGEKVSFELNGNNVGNSLWSGESIVELNLGKKVSNSLGLWLAIIGIVIVLLIVFSVYMEKHKKR